MTDTRMIDLHVHSNASDGTFSPEALIAEAHKAGLSAMALTDHDTMDGVAAAAKAAGPYGIELVPGIELSTTYRGFEVHVLGYYLSPDHPGLRQKTEEFRDFRATRNVRMAARLREEGFDITMEQLLARFPDCILTRAHFARYLYETGQIADIQIAFRDYIGDQCKCYIKRPQISPIEAVTLIREAGGLAALAHPALCKLPQEDFLHMVRQMQEAGMCALEAVYSENSAAQERQMRQLASSLGLLITGGSDFHGANKPHIQLGRGKGNLRIPYAFLQSLQDLL